VFSPAPRLSPFGPRFTVGAEAEAVDPNRLALLSDIHVKAERTALGREINMWDHFQRVTDEVLAVSPRPCAALVNGDVAFQRRPAG
jgi:hypothetical protein